MSKLTEEGQHKDAIVSDTQLINIIEIISWRKILILIGKLAKKKKNNNNSAKERDRGEKM